MSVNKLLRHVLMTLLYYTKPHTIDFVPMTATSCPSSPVAMVTVALQAWRCHSQQ